jgi:hypothetical protein
VKIRFPSDIFKGRDCLDDTGVDKKAITRLLKKYGLRISGGVS